MKKFFSMLLLLCGALTLSATLIGVNAAEPVADDTITFSDNGYTNQEAVSKVELPNSTITFSSGSKYYNTGTAIRVYGGKTFTVEAKNSNTITEIILTFGTGDSTSNKITVSNGTYTEPKWSGSATSVIFTNTGSGQRRLSGMTIKLLPANAEKYTVTFADGESTLSTQTVVKDAKVVKPANPEKDGFIFVDWYKTNPATDNSAVAWNFEADTVTDNITLYAKWEDDPLSHVKINITSFQQISSKSGYEGYNGTHDIDGVAIISNQVMVSSSVLQFQKDTGYLNNTVAISGHIDYIEMEITEGTFTVSTSTSALTEDGANVVTLNSENKKMIVENPNDSYFLIKVGSATGKVSSIKINYAYVEKTTYAATFSAGTGAFVPGKGGDVTEDIGTPMTVTLPTQDDLSKTPYNYSVLTGWKAGTTTYEPGASVPVSEDTSFVAVYGAPENITVAQALEIAELAGSTGTSFKFITTAKVMAPVDGKNLVLGDTSTNETIVAYASSSSKIESFKVGDIVKVVGKIKIYTNYNTQVSTKQYDQPSFTLVAPVASTNFKTEETKASLKIVNENVSIRFGNAISVDSYFEGATYGVVVSTDANDLADLTKAGIEALIAANKGVQCTPVKVAAPGATDPDPNGNYYQFAAVLENVPTDNYTTVLHAVMYMIYGDQVFVTAVKTASVQSVAQAYLDGDKSNFSAGTITALEALAQNN